MKLAVAALALAIGMPMIAQQTSQPSTQANPGMSQPDQNSTQPNPGMSQPDQNSTQPPDNSQGMPSQSNQSAGTTASNTGTDAQAGQTLTGTISADGKTFNSNGTSYTISNPNSVKPYAGQPVTVGYDMDTNNAIRITKVMLTKPQQ